MENPVKLLNDFAFLGNEELLSLNNACGWSLNIKELLQIQNHFRKLKRPPTRAEMETIAQTWSEHCKHKTFAGPVVFKCNGKTKKYKNLFKETIVKATRKLHKKWCLSVFKDNAGIVEFGKNKKWGLAFKVETHNHPCAIEPYGGAETGVGGVIRDIMGVGLGAKPVLNTDVFFFGRIDSKMKLPPHALSAGRIFRGVVEGVRDYGNRMGIPTAAGGICFDDGYALNSLVYVGCAGIIPVEKIHKKAKTGDIILAIGGRTGRDGIHGATFSSADIVEETSSSAVQIGHAINEKKVLDALLKARDLNLYNAVTDCGAGGFSSAIGELGAETGARVCLENAKLKDTSLAPWEIWVSESQERMILSVPAGNIKKFIEILEAENCEYCSLGHFTNDKKLVVTHKGTPVVNLDMSFLHGGIPKLAKQASHRLPSYADRLRKGRQVTGHKPPKKNKKYYLQILKRILSHSNVCSRHSVIQQYDHEVQGGTIVKPLAGLNQNGPSDAAVIWPHSATGDLNDFSGFAVSHGFNPFVGKINPYQMALYSADEAVRNLLCVGADIIKTAFLDNFCAGNPENPEIMGDIVLAAEGCYDAAMGFGAPFISGKDSFYNQSKDANGRDYAIPTTLLISATAPVQDIRKAITMNLKLPGNPVFIAGITAKGLGGSIYNEIEKSGNNHIAQADIKKAVKLYNAILKTIKAGFVASAHDVSDGGFAAAISEMAFAGGLGAEIDLSNMPREKGISEIELLFAESPSRLILEVKADKEKSFLKIVRGLPVSKIGYATSVACLEIKKEGAVLIKENIESLKNCWKQKLL
ncbi:MAG: phosphoribosylformylglycinamidine synthase subunit PurL [Elusimicrobia bacterium]|nr:phosphoribosylformylglycinamidine synthase subunit PurL [Elusimicrobiota bacterium]